MRARVVALAACLLVAGAADLAAQASVYGVRGLGYPGRMTNTRGRALGGGPIAWDPGSPINPAAAASYGGVAVEVMAETDLRSYAVDTVDVNGLSSTRFPLALLAGPIGRTRLSFAVSYSQYSERSYDIQRSDTIDIRGAPVGFTERTTSRGGASDLRGALAYRVGSSLRVGAAMHLLTGSAKLTFERAFSDSAYRPYRVQGEEAVSGLGVSVGAVWIPSPRMIVGLAVRSDTKAEVRVDSVPSGDIELPLRLTGGLQLAPARSVRWMSSVSWQSWGGADGQVAGHAFDTWELGTGVEVGGPEAGGSRFPLRAGFRYATLPFSPVDEQPNEMTIAVGVGGAFAQNRGLVDLAAERVMRRGAGASENAWQLTWTVTVRP